MERRFYYKWDKFTKRTTWIVSILIVLGLVASYLFSGESYYLSTWFALLILCVVTLYILSFPRYIKLTSENLEIHCIVELTKINLRDITEIRRLDPLEMKRTIPLLGSFGFGGYYGYYFQLRDWNLIKLYATRWTDFVLITNIYEDRFVINCDDPDELIARTEAWIESASETEDSSETGLWMESFRTPPSKNATPTSKHVETSNGTDLPTPQSTSKTSISADAPVIPETLSDTNSVHKDRENPS